MATLELTVAPDYVNWNVWEALREILQNWKDADDIGYEGRLWYSTAKGVPSLKMINKGVVVDRDKLVLGTSTKRGDHRQRGKFGEGMKLAWACLLHNGLTVWIKSGDEVWEPLLEHSDTFGCTLMKIKTRKGSRYYDGFECHVRGVHKDDWATVQKRLLWETPPKEVIQTSHGQIILDDDHRGVLFSKDIYVGKLPNEYEYGYNIDVELDRDRKMADPWSLQYAVGNAIRDAVKRDLIDAKEIISLLEKSPGSGEARIFAEEANHARYNYSRDFHKKISEAFIDEHGEDAIPVSSMGDSVEAKHHGMTGVVVSPAVKAIIEVEQGTFDDRKSKRALDVDVRYGASDLEDDELANLTRACEILALVGDAYIPASPMDGVEVVSFVGEKVMGLFVQRGDEPGRVMVSRKILGSKQELIATLIHEFAHNYGGDGTVAHRDAIDLMFGRIVAAFW